MSSQRNPQQQPPQQQPPPQEPVREREVIVTDGGRERSGIAGVLIGLVAIVLIAIVGFFVIQAIGSSDGVEIPDEVDVNIDNPADEAPAEPNPDDGGT